MAIFHSNEELLRSSQKNLEQVCNVVADLNSISLMQIDTEYAALIIVDMVNGFVKEGPLSSPNALAINQQVARLMRVCVTGGMHCVFFADSHTIESPEFGSYPIHCLSDSSQSRPTEELAAIGGFTLIPKNSTNGFLEPEFLKWMKSNDKISTFLVVGCCTDICVQQFALTLKTDFNRRNMPSRIIVPMNLCSTYDAPDHDSSLNNLMSFYNMHTNGIEVTLEIEY